MPLVESSKNKSIAFNIFDLPALFSPIRMVILSKSKEIDSIVLNDSISTLFILIWIPI